MRLGILAGTGFADMTATATASERVRVETPWGSRDLTVAHAGKKTLFFLNRHGDGHAVPPHRIDHRANVAAIRHARVDLLLSVLNTGGLRPGLHPGDLVVPHDFVDTTGATPTLFDDAAVHVDLTEPYCPAAREAVLAAARATAGTVHPRGVYVATSGPRLETPAEVAHLARLGDVVGMTGAAEAALAREADLCHAALAFVANPAAGLAHRLDAQAIRAALAARAADIARILLAAAALFPAARECGCRQAAQAGRLTPHAMD